MGITVVIVERMVVVEEELGGLLEEQRWYGHHGFGKKVQRRGEQPGEIGGKSAKSRRVVSQPYDRIHSQTYRHGSLVVVEEGESELDRRGSRNRNLFGQAADQHLSTRVAAAENRVKPRPPTLIF